MPLKLPSFRARRDVYPPDLWTQCPTCSTMLFNKQLDKNLRVCPTLRPPLPAVGRRPASSMLLDPGHVGRARRRPAVGRRARLRGPEGRTRTGSPRRSSRPGMRDAAVWGTGAHRRARRSRSCVMDFGFMGGSMGAVVGEKVTRAAEHALAERVPLIVVSASGGARMQEGTLALMQLAKTLAALERLRDGRRARSSRSCPTRRPAASSPRSRRLGDVNVAEPDALIGFAGARVAAGTIAAELPPGFQRAEFLFSHGFVDRVVARAELRDELAALLRLLPPRGCRRRGRAPVDDRARRSGRCRSSRRSPTASASSRRATAPTAGRRRPERGRRTATAGRRRHDRTATALEPTPRPPSPSRRRSGRGSSSRAPRAGHAPSSSSAP